MALSPYLSRVWPKLAFPRSPSPNFKRVSDRVLKSRKTMSRVQKLDRGVDVWLRGGEGWTEVNTSSTCRASGTWHGCVILAWFTGFPGHGLRCALKHRILRPGKNPLSLKPTAYFSPYGQSTVRVHCAGIFSLVRTPVVFPLISSRTNARSDMV